MKFAEHLSAHITPEWRKQYINYEEMKSMLYSTVEAAPSAENVEPEVLSRHFANFDEAFFHYCDQELKKINTFYSEKLAEATRKYATLESEMKILYDNKQKDGSKKAALSSRKVQELKLAFSEFYLSLILLQNYQNLNHTGFRKILKKHDKLLSVTNGAKWRAEQVEQSHFYINKDIDRIINDTENSFINELEGGDRQKAMKRLRVPPLGEQQSPWTTFKVGLFSGSFIVLLVAVVLSGLFHNGSEEILKMALRLYRGPMLLIIFLFLIGVNVYGWRSSGVNHVLIFELDPRNHLSEQHLMEMAAVFGVVWALSLLSFLYSTSLSVPPLVNPLILTVMMMAFLLNPLRIFKHEARFWFLRICGKMIAAPFFQVAFADFWMADQLNSLVIALLDFYFLTCFYMTSDNWWDTKFPATASDTAQCLDKSYIIRPIVNCLPAWFRFAQCVRRYRDSKDVFPHLVNAGKYSTTFLVVIFTTLKNFYDTLTLVWCGNTILWAIAVLWTGGLLILGTNKENGETKGARPLVKSPWKFDKAVHPFYVHFFFFFNLKLLSSIYAYLWDLKMDWGLFDSNADNKILREEVVYSSNYYYYFAIIEDLILRFFWSISYLLTSNGLISSEVMITMQALLEVTRRFIWNFFRLENEHLNNCGQFRAVRDISVAPLDSSDQNTILRMMDEENGVVNRYQKKKGPKKHKDPEKKALIKKESIHDMHLEMDLSSKKL